MHLLAKILLAPLIALLSLGGYTFTPQKTNPVATLRLGDFNPSGGGTYRLQSSIGTTDTSLTLSSFKEPVSNILYTMSYLNSTIEYGTLEPSNNTSKEFVSFTGITQNSDGTATLTGLTRGLGFSYPYTSSTTLQQAHSAQSIFILSNPPQLTNQYGNKNNAENISGLWTFTDPPIFTNSATSSRQAASIGYVTGVALNGAGTSTESIIGVVKLSTQTQVANGTASTTDGAPLVIPTRLATSTGVSSAGYIPTTNSSGKISTGFMATSSLWNFGGTVGIATSSPSKDFSIQGNSYTSGTSYFGGAITATSTVSLSGAITSTAGTTNTLPYASSTAITVSGTASTTGIIVSNTATLPIYATTSASATSGSSIGNTATANAICLSGDLAIGGGFTSSGNSAGFGMTRSNNSTYSTTNDSWSATVETFANAAASVTAYAVCLNQ